MFSMFPDGDLHCVIPKPKLIKGKSVLIVHRLYPDQNQRLVQLLLLVDLLKDLGAHSIEVFCPYLPYSRQDIRHLPGEAVGSSALCRVLALAGCKRLYTLDCHFMRGDEEGIYNGLAIKNIPVSNILVEEAKRLIGNESFHVVGPDQGASLLNTQVGDTYMFKERGGYIDIGTITKRSISTLTGDHLSLKHPIAVIVDDIVSTGATMLQAVNNLHNNGVKSIYCAVTHGLFVHDSLKKLEKATSRVITSDSVVRQNAVPLVDELARKVIIPYWQKWAQ
jgi:ribose-phosphate pyrophosphokinase